MSTVGRRLHPEMIISISATIISLCALVTTYWQTRINREWQQASVWPRLTFVPGSSTNTDTNTATYELGLANVGIGPALITDFIVKYRGEVLRAEPRGSRLSAFFHKAAAEQQVKSERTLRTSQRELDPGTVLTADKSTNLFSMKGDITYARAIEEGLKHLEVIIQYSSVYGETWEVTYPLGNRRFVGWTKAEVH
jgi:hypothetical protein